MRDVHVHMRTQAPDPLRFEGGVSMRGCEPAYAIAAVRTKMDGGYQVVGSLVHPLP